MELHLICAYLGALFMLAKHGRTFAKEANELVREIADPGVSVGEVFEAIEREPASPFEGHLKATAHNIARSGV